MLGSEYGKQDRKTAVLYEYETFKATEGELLFDTYIRYLQVINYLKKCGYSKDNCEMNFKFLNNLQPEWKQYATMMRQNKNLMDINIDALYNILKHNQGDVNDAMGSKKKTVVVTFDPLALIAEKTNRVEKKDDEKKRDMSKFKCYNCKKEGHFAKDCKKAKGNQPNDNAGIKENLDAEFSFNSTNRINTVSALVNVVRPNPTNSTNNSNTASPSVNAVSPNFGIAVKSLFMDLSKYLDDPDMPKLEDIVYSDDEEDVGAEADVRNRHSCC
nr:hypothetical protein [Tanacetum cinerariifolium]